MFDRDLGEEMNWTLLPIGIAPPVDPISYLQGTRSGNKSTRTAVDEFLGSLADQIADLEQEGIDTAHFMTVYNVKLQSVKKLERADIVVGVDGEAAGGGEPVFIERRVDPLKSHPFRQKNVLAEIRELHGRRFTQWDFQAMVHHFGLRDKPEFHWYDPETNVRRWSRDVVTFIRRRSEEQLAEARAAYRDYRRERRQAGATSG